MRDVVELALGAAGVVDLLQDFEKIREWFHGNPPRRFEVACQGVRKTDRLES
jgi:hypothetical protein